VTQGEASFSSTLLSSRILRKFAFDFQRQCHITYESEPANRIFNTKIITKSNNGTYLKMRIQFLIIILATTAMMTAAFRLGSRYATELFKILLNWEPSSVVVTLDPYIQSARPPAYPRAKTEHEIEVLRTEVLERVKMHHMRILSIVRRVCEVLDGLGIAAPGVGSVDGVADVRHFKMIVDEMSVLVKSEGHKMKLGRTTGRGLKKVKMLVDGVIEDVRILDQYLEYAAGRVELLVGGLDGVLETERQGGKEAW
jgi:hypothetical protein